MSVREAAGEMLLWGSDVRAACQQQWLMLEHEKEAPARQRTAAGSGVGERGPSTVTTGHCKLSQAGVTARPSAKSPRRQAKGRALTSPSVFLHLPRE